MNITDPKLLNVSVLSLPASAILDTVNYGIVFSENTLLHEPLQWNCLLCIILIFFNLVLFYADLFYQVVCDVKQVFFLSSDDHYLHCFLFSMQKWSGLVLIVLSVYSANCLASNNIFTFSLHRSITDKVTVIFSKNYTFHDQQQFILGAGNGAQFYKEVQMC